VQVDAQRRERDPSSDSLQPAKKRTWVGWLTGAANPAASESEAGGEMRADLTPEEVARLQEMVAERDDAMVAGRVVLPRSISKAI
jgi:hypothetical protein